MTAQLAIAPSNSQSLDEVMNVLLSEARGIQPGYALRKAYEVWARQALKTTAVVAPGFAYVGSRPAYAGVPQLTIRQRIELSKAPPDEALRSIARTTGRVLTLLEDEDKFPRAAHRLSGRLKVTREQARFLLTRIFELWHFEPGGDPSTWRINSDKDYVGIRIDELLDQIFPIGANGNVADVVVPTTRAPESTLEEWTDDLLRNAECVVVVGGEQQVIVGNDEVTAFEHFVNLSMPKVLENLGDDNTWTWLVDLGLATSKGQPDWHKYSYLVRLYGALASFAHHLKYRLQDEVLLNRFLSTCFVGVRGVPDASTKALQRLDPAALDATRLDFHINLEKLFNVVTSDKDRQQTNLERLAIGIKTKAPAEECVVYLPRFPTSGDDRSAQSSTVALAVTCDVMRPDEEFTRAFDLIQAAVLQVRANSQRNESRNLSAEEFLLLTRGIEMYTVKQFLQSDWLSLSLSTPTDQ